MIERAKFALGRRLARLMGWRSSTAWTEADSERLREAWAQGLVGGSDPVELFDCGDGTGYVLDACGWPVWFCTVCDGEGWTRDTIEHFDGCELGAVDAPERAGAT